MISKNAVYDRVAKAILAYSGDAYVTSERVLAPSSFPCVWILEINSAPVQYATALDFSDEQRRSEFEIQAFATGDNASDDAEELISVATSAMRGMYYLCTGSGAVENYDDPSVKRHVARYTRVIGSGDTLPLEQTTED